jgi:hypothetical protein
MLIDLVEQFKRNSIQAFGKSLTQKGKKRNRRRRLLVRESRVWHEASCEIRKAALLEPAERSKPAEPGSVIEERFYMIEISAATGIKSSKVRIINFLLSRGKTLEKISAAAGVSMTKLRELIRMFPRLGSYPEGA